MNSSGLPRNIASFWGLILRRIEAAVLLVNVLLFEISPTRSYGTVDVLTVVMLFVVVCSPPKLSTSFWSPMVITYFSSEMNRLELIEQTA